MGKDDRGASKNAASRYGFSELDLSVHHGGLQSGSNAEPDDRLGIAGRIDVRGPQPRPHVNPEVEATPPNGAGHRSLGEFFSSLLGLSLVPPILGYPIKRTRVPPLWPGFLGIENRETYLYFLIPAFVGVFIFLQAALARRTRA